MAYESPADVLAPVADDQRYIDFVLLYRGFLWFTSNLCLGEEWGVLSTLLKLYCESRSTFLWCFCLRLTVVVKVGVKSSGDLVGAEDFHLAWTLVVYQCSLWPHRNYSGVHLSLVFIYMNDDNSDEKCLTIIDLSKVTSQSDTLPWPYILIIRN